MKEGFTQARLDALPPAHTALRQAQKDFLDADQTRLEGARARTQAYDALDTRSPTSALGATTITRPATPPRPAPTCATPPPGLLQ